MSDENYEKFLERSINVTHPLGKSLNRIALPEEVGDLISFLASNKAKFITGECIAIGKTLFYRYNLSHFFLLTMIEELSFYLPFFLFVFSTLYIINYY